MRKLVWCEFEYHWSCFTDQTFKLSWNVWDFDQNGIHFNNMESDQAKFFSIYEKLRTSYRFQIMR